MTLEDQLVQEISELGKEYEEKWMELYTKYERQYEALDKEKEEKIASLEARRSRKWSRKKKEVGALDALRGELQAMDNAPRRIEDLREKIKRANKNRAASRRELNGFRRKWLWQNIGGPLSMAVIPVGLFVGGIGIAVSSDYTANPATSCFQLLGGLLVAFGGPILTLKVLSERLPELDKNAYSTERGTLKQRISNLNDKVMRLYQRLDAEKELAAKDDSTLRDKVARAESYLSTERKKLDETIDSQIAKVEKEYSTKRRAIREEHDEALDSFPTDYGEELGRRKARLKWLRKQRPNIAMSNKYTKRFTMDEYTKAEIPFFNKGKGNAFDITVALEGDFEGKKSHYIREINPGKRQALEVSIKPTAYGEIDWHARVKYKDELGRPYRTNFRYWVRIEKPAKEPDTVVAGGDYAGGDMFKDVVATRSNIGRNSGDKRPK